MHRATLDSVITQLIANPEDDSFLRWPPDVFGVAAMLLKLSGGYIHVVNSWPPKSPRKAKPKVDEHEWNAAMRAIGVEWQVAAAKSKPPPREIRQWWAHVRANGAKDISDLYSDAELCRILLQLVAAADEACTDIGIPDAKESSTLTPSRQLEWHAMVLMQKQLKARKPCTLCKHIPASLLAVLPKLHTPTVGATLRSLTHNLALHERPEIAVRWTQITTELDHSINLLCVPWPLEVHPVNFTKADTTNIQLKNMRGDAHFFDYTPPKQARFVKMFEELLKTARSKVGTIDGVVFPELAMDLQTFKQVRAVLNRIVPASCLIAGVRAHNRNDSYCSIPDSADMKLREVRERQAKHHRWKLNKAQIEQYGLGGRLDAECTWWESTVVEPRTMNFFSLQPWLTLGVLICEDLARQDPVGDLIRAVGPNLVVALLMDGPQLASRWPARYATVLADDPGSSVLTLSSLGMVLLSKPFDKPTSRVVGLWKDYTSSAAVEIELPVGKTGIVLSLSRQRREEYSADGRSDDRATAYLMLTGMHPI